MQNHEQRLSARFGVADVALSDGAGELDLSLLGISGVPATAVKPTAHANRITYARGAVSEWYANGPMGIEQGFNVAHPVGASSDNTLTLALSLGGSLRARMQAGGRGVLLSAPGGKVALRYGQLSASDSTGRSLPVSLALHGHSLQFSVRTAGARYPLSIDPIVQEGQLSGPSEGIGSSVAIEGSTIVVGAAGEIVSGGAKRDGQAEPQGAVFVFKEPAGGWANTTKAAELVASDADAEEYSGNEGGDGLGTAVAISGKTIVASAPSATAGERIYAGKVYVFEEPEDGWINSYQNAELAASDAIEYGHLGSSVATDGQTVVAGEPNALSADDEGLAGPGELYVFSRSGSKWGSELQNARLTAGDKEEGDALGWSVAFAGTTIVGGAPYDKVAGREYQGALYLYKEPSSGGWKDAIQNVKLTAPSGVSYETLGTAVASDGTTIVAGAANDADPGNTPSSAYVFAEPNSGWSNTTPPLARLTPTEPERAEHFGGSVGISGSTVVVGAEFAPTEKPDYGATYVYDEPAGGWTSTSQQNAKLYAPEGSVQQGGSVAVSGSTIIATAPYATAAGKSYQGAVYVFGGEASHEQGSKESSKETPTTNEPIVTPTGSTTLHYTSTAPPAPERETFIGFPLNVNPGEPIACIGNVCTYAVIKCKKAKEPCIGSASYEEIAGAVASSASAKTKKKLKKKPVVYGRGTFSIPAGTVGKITIKLTAAGRKLLKGKKSARGRLKITTTQLGGKTATSSSIVTIKLASKKHSHK
jgi:hypothetical protein